MDTTQTAPPPPGGPHILGASLRRSSTDRFLLGLCGGLARATGAHPTAIRIGTILVGVVLLPVVLLAYVVTAAILPCDDGSALIGEGRRDRRDVVVALLCTFIAAPLVLGAGTAAGLTTGPWTWPLLPIAAVLALATMLYRPRRPGRTYFAPGPDGGTAVRAASATEAAAAADAATASTADVPDDAATAVTAAYAAYSGAGAAAPAGAPAPPPAPERPTFTPPAPAQNQVRRRSLALPVLTLMAVIPAVTALLVALGIATGGWNTWAIMFGLLALAAAGGGVAIAILRPSYLGAGLLVVLAAMLGCASIAISQVGPFVDDGVGERVYKPTTVADLPSSYVHGLGALDIDLRELRLRPGSTTPLRVEIGFGAVRIAVPSGTRVVAAADSQIPDLTASATGTGGSAGERRAAPTLVLDLHGRGADVELLTGRSKNLANLEVLAHDNVGFWNGSGESRRRVDALPPTPADPGPTTR